MDWETFILEFGTFEPRIRLWWFIYQNCRTWFRIKWRKMHMKLFSPLINSMSKLNWFIYVFSTHYSIFFVQQKELCDIDFKRCLYNYCDTHEKTTVGSIVAKGCKAAAKMLFTGTITLGCKSYLDSQERACYCAPPSSSSTSSSKSDQKNGYKKNKKYQKSDSNYEKGPPPAGWNIPN